jgi:UDP-N-acetylmuramate--alanine ligase
MTAKIRVGIFFGGASREREVSFAGGRTVYDNLDKNLFEAIPIFVDSFGNFVILQWEYVYKGSIRDFYPPASFLPDLPYGFQVYAESLQPDYTLQQQMLNSLGQSVSAEELRHHIDFAFLALHGTLGEDGTIQGLLEWYNIPYSGSGIFASSLGINKSRQKDFQERAGLYVNHYQTLKRDAWLQADDKERGNLFFFYNREFKENFVVKPANQGSSLGVSVLKNADFNAFERAVNLAFFRLQLGHEEWILLNQEEKIDFIKEITDIRSGLGLPLLINGDWCFMPDDLLNRLNQILNQAGGSVLLESPDAETEVVFEEFIQGREFSCIVVRDDQGNPIALPPTEIRKKTDYFDYRSKYLPGLSHKITPMPGSSELLEEIRTACTALYDFFGFNVYARIDGFVSDENEVFLNDPNTTSGMMPSSFFFHQAAEIGLNPARFLTFIVRNSLAERIETQPRSQWLRETLSLLDKKIDDLSSGTTRKQRIAVIMGGYSYERHISMESGRNIYEKLSSSEEFDPVPVFLTGNAENLRIFMLPLNTMLKDNADDIREKVLHFEQNLVLDSIVSECGHITERYNPGGMMKAPREITFAELADMVSGVFIALHGRPGEDGTLQQELEKYGLFYNGSKQPSAAITINKFITNQKLRENGFLVADHRMLTKQDWLDNTAAEEQNIINRFGLPLIAKPADDGCSAAVRKVKTAEELHHFITGIFRNSGENDSEIRQKLGLTPNEEFPIKQELLIEKFIDKGNAARFLEITGGMLTHRNEDGSVRYEVFEPSEALAESEILSLEEKFLAGQGQNLTPSRFSRDIAEQSRISQEVRKTLEAVARCLQVTGYCRIDAFVKIMADGSIETWIIEVNSLPGMTPATCIYHQAAINGYKPFDFIRNILKFGKDSLSSKHE